MKFKTHNHKSDKQFNSPKPGPFGQIRIVPVTSEPTLIFDEIKEFKDYYYNLTVYPGDETTEVYKAWNRPLSEKTKIASDSWYQKTSITQDIINQPIKVWVDEEKTALIAYQLAEILYG